ncbi:MAG: bifunctional phosphopantothenoylcysteine decarboxylase/phosphopantothenate--cysteine ligase CoaBC [Candidatus Thermoplasmatota archaeon]
MTHPSEELRGTKSAELKGKIIVLGITGSIAAVEVIKLARELIRHSASVVGVMSFEAQKIIHPNAVEFATGNKPITEITGKVEHVSLCGSTKSKASLLLIAPCTANTISKIACGIDDTPVTTFATTALGSKIPILIVPAMHASMYEHEIVQENIKKLKALGIEFIEPKLEEGKAKFPGIEEIVARVIRKIGKNDFQNKKILVIAGSTKEPIDDVRYITAKSTGKTGIEIAKSAFQRGAEVKLFYGYAAEPAPDYIITEGFESIEDLKAKLKNLNFYDAIICPAAISDYIPEREAGKLSSEKERLSLSLHRAPKILELIRKNYKKYLVGFKLESNVSKKELLERAYKKLKNEKLDLIVANDFKNISYESSEVLIIDRNKNVIVAKGRKEEIANRILDKIKEELS